jgi:glycosyltransferase involved in cell wall biosynthesis
MKLLWAGSSFLHPTTRGGQIRTLETLRRMHQRHEIHYAALARPEEQEGVARANEYATRTFPFEIRPSSKGSLRFAGEVAAGALSSLPLAIRRWRSLAMFQGLGNLIREQRYDAMVCDFLVTSINFPELEKAALFQHNVESVIWKRHAENAADPVRRSYFRQQERKMLAFERAACRRAGQVIAVSKKDAATIKDLFSVDAAAVPTGVDIDAFHAPHAGQKHGGVVFIGSMDWMPNIDGVRWFVQEVLPILRQKQKDLPVTIVGRTPPASVQALASADPYFKVTGTVPDVRPYLWASEVSIVPLRIGGGTRLKIYESMAAGVPVVSTTIGAEGLDAADGETIALADTPEEFARRVLDLIGDAGARARIGAKAQEMVASRYSWERVSLEFEHLLTRAVEPVTR